MPRCPSCQIIMTDVIQNDMHAKTCSVCFGIWISREGLLRLVRKPQVDDQNPQSSQASLQDLAAVATESDTPKPMVCPECSQKMRIDRIHPIIPVNLQFCDKCHDVWVDVGKLPLIQRLYTEFQNSTDPKIVEIREKYAMAQLGMEITRERQADALAMARSLNSPVSWHSGLGAAELQTIISALSGR